MVWQQPLAYPSSLRFHSSGESILCTSNNASIIRLDLRSGNTIEVLHGFNRLVEGVCGGKLGGGQLRVPVGCSPLRLLNGRREVEIPVGGFALLDARFSPDAVCLTEARGPVRCIECASGRERWRFDPGADGHVLLLHYSSSMDAFFGILLDFSGNGRYLIRFDVRSGSHEKVCKLDSWAEVFVEQSDQVVTSGGEVRNLTDGALAVQLAFPVTEYPDQ